MDVGSQRSEFTIVQFGDAQAMETGLQRKPTEVALVSSIVVHDPIARQRNDTALNAVGFPRPVASGASLLICLSSHQRVRERSSLTSTLFVLLCYTALNGRVLQAMRLSALG